MSNKTTIILGDLHFPWVSRASLSRTLKLIKKINPDRVVQIGDLYDMYSWARFARSHNVTKPRDEMEDARAMAQRMWIDIQDAAPDVACYQLRGNHDERLHSRVFAQLPELESFVDFDSLWKFPGVKTQSRERDELILDGVCYQHGFRTKNNHALHNLMSTVVGHTHKGGVWYYKIGDKTIWELNAGYLADRSAFPLSYTRQRHLSNWTLGFGIIDELGPRFVPIDG